MYFAGFKATTKNHSQLITKLGIKASRNHNETIFKAPREFIILIIYLNLLIIINIPC